MTPDTIAIVVTIVSVTVGATYTISRKLGGIEEKVNVLDKKVSETRIELKADIKELEERLKADITKVEERLKADIAGLKADMSEVEGRLKADIKLLEDRTFEMSKLLGSIEAEISSLIKK
ncbi:MAG TPA: hypothetical protein ACFYD3_02270 [Candidatus Hypogeohydataceae bacterium YC41]